MAINEGEVIKMKTAEQIRKENWTSSEQWNIFRAGKKDGIVVLFNNPPWGRCRSPMVSFKIFKNGKCVAYANSYEDVRYQIKYLKVLK